MLNVNGVNTRRGTTPHVEAMVTAEGVRVTADHPRVPRLGATMAALFAALVRAGAFPVWKGHGARWIVGEGSPMFTERVGLSDGTIYMYACGAKRDAVLAAFPSGCVASTRIESKGGLYVTLAPLSDADADAVVKASLLFSSKGKGDNWKADLVGCGLRLPMPETVAAAMEAAAAAKAKADAEAAEAAAAAAKVKAEADALVAMVPVPVPVPVVDAATTALEAAATNKVKGKVKRRVSA